MVIKTYSFQGTADYIKRNRKTDSNYSSYVRLSLEVVIELKENVLPTVNWYIVT